MKSIVVKVSSDKCWLDARNIQDLLSIADSIGSKFKVRKYKPRKRVCSTCKKTAIHIRELESQVKKAMVKDNIPSGEHWHVASIIFEMNAKIVQLKRELREARAK